MHRFGQGDVPRGEVVAWFRRGGRIFRVGMLLTRQPSRISDLVRRVLRG